MLFLFLFGPRRFKPFLSLSPFCLQNGNSKIKAYRYIEAAQFPGLSREMFALSREFTRNISYCELRQGTMRDGGSLIEDFDEFSHDDH